MSCTVGVDLSGHHSNPSRPLETCSPPIWRLFAGARPGPRAPAEAGSARARQSRMGVLEAIVKVLVRGGRPCRHVRSTRRPRSSSANASGGGTVKAGLAANISGPDLRFVRVCRGRYALHTPRPNGPPSARLAGRTRCARHPSRSRGADRDSEQLGPPTRPTIESQDHHARSKVPANTNQKRPTDPSRHRGQHSQGVDSAASCGRPMSLLVVVLPVFFVPG